MTHCRSGRATVDLFLLHGAKIVVLDRDAPALPFGENVVLHQGSVASVFFNQKPPSLFGQTVADVHMCGLREEAVWGQAIELSVATYGVTPNVLIQCAGVSGKSRIHECPLKEWLVEIVDSGVILLRFAVLSNWCFC